MTELESNHYECAVYSRKQVLQHADFLSFQPQILNLLKWLCGLEGPVLPSPFHVLSE